MRDASLHEDDNICLAFTFRVTNSAVNAATRYSAKVGFLLTQGFEGAITVDGGTGVASMAATNSNDSFYCTGS